jgi:hypothetical protein
VTRVTALRAPQPLPVTEPLPPVEEKFLPEFEICEPETTQTIRGGQSALEVWALETQQKRESLDVPTIHRPSNFALRENQSQDVRCPNCGCEFSTELKA